MVNLSADVKAAEELVETRLIVKLIGGKNYLSGHCDRA